MNLSCLGVNWKTPIKLREKLAFDKQKLSRALERWRERYSDQEVAILSTCNRTEIYTASSVNGVAPSMLCNFLAEQHELAPETFADYAYIYQGIPALSHLFRVASGLDSLVLGEVQILGQVKEGYQSATDAKTVGPFLHALFQRAISVAKRVQNETDLTKGRLSIASAAVDYVRGVFDRFEDKTLLVIGAGKMAELVLTHFRELGPKHILITNRSIDRAEELARKFGGKTRLFGELASALVEADIVISSTGAELPIVKAADFQPILKARKHRLMAIIDIAVPRDFDPAIRDFDNVLLSNIDDLERVREQTIGTRRRELDAALRIVETETQAFQTDLAVRQSGPVIGQLEREYQRLLQQELDWLLPQLNNVGDDEREKIKQFGNRLKNKFLHQPKIVLREQAQHGPAHHSSFIEAFRKLFGLAQE